MSPAATSTHRRPLEALGLPEPATSRLARYLDTLAAWSPRVNLTGARTPEERVARLVEGVLDVASVPDPGTLLDVGSGNGSPGLVLALLRDDLDVTLLEPRTRRWAFLREAARCAGRPDVRVLRDRHDTFAGPPSRTVTLRALALPLGELASLVAGGGRLIVLGRAPAPEGPFQPEAPAVPRPDVHVFRRLGANVPRGT